MGLVDLVGLVSRLWVKLRKIAKESGHVGPESKSHKWYASGRQGWKNWQTFFPDLVDEREKFRDHTMVINRRHLSLCLDHGGFPYTGGANLSLDMKNVTLALESTASSFQDGL